jgi:hypothetical protein
MLDGEFGAFERLLRIVWVRRASAFFVVLGGHEPQRATNQGVHDVRLSALVRVVE